MGKKLNELLNKARLSGQILPFDPFIHTSSADDMVYMDVGYDIIFKYNILARFLPDFIESFSLENLKRSKKFKNASKGLRIQQLMEQKSRSAIEKEMIEDISINGNQIVKKYFMPRKVKIEKLALEQQQDFLMKCNKLRRSFFSVKDRSVTQIINIDKRIRLQEAPKIFELSRYDPDLFLSYFKAHPTIDNFYLTSGLNYYRTEYLLAERPDESTYTEILKVLKSRPRDIGVAGTIRSLHIYKEFYQYYMDLKKQGKKDYKIEAINELKRKGRYGSIREITKIYTSFLRFVENSDLKPFETQKYLDYLCNRFPQKSD